jgi:hypothetical protein
MEGNCEDLPATRNVPTSRAQLATLAPELARVVGADEALDRGGTCELQKPNGAVYAWPANQGHRTGFLCDLSTMVGAIEISSLLPDPAIQKKVLGSARDFLLRSF